MLETVEASENCHVGTGAFPHKMWQDHSSKWRPSNVNAYSMGNKQEGLEDVVQQGNSDVSSIMKTWRDDWHSWSPSMDAINSSEGIAKEEQAMG